MTELPAMLGTKKLAKNTEQSQVKKTQKASKTSQNKKTITAFTTSIQKKKPSATQKTQKSQSTLNKPRELQQKLQN